MNKIITEKTDIKQIQDIINQFIDKYQNNIIDANKRYAKTIVRKIKSYIEENSVKLSPKIRIKLKAIEDIITYYEDEIVQFITDNKGFTDIISKYIIPKLKIDYDIIIADDDKEIHDIFTQITKDIDDAIYIINEKKIPANFQKFLSKIGAGTLKDSDVETFELLDDFNRKNRGQYPVVFALYNNQLIATIFFNENGTLSNIYTEQYNRINTLAAINRNCNKYFAIKSDKFQEEAIKLQERYNNKQYINPKSDAEISARKMDERKNIITKRKEIETREKLIEIGNNTIQQAKDFIKKELSKSNDEILTNNKILEIRQMVLTLIENIKNYKDYSFYEKSVREDIKTLSDLIK